MQVHNLSKKLLGIENSPPSLSDHVEGSPYQWKGAFFVVCFFKFYLPHNNFTIKNCDKTFLKIILRLKKIAKKRRRFDVS